MPQRLGKLQNYAHAVGQFLIVALEYLVEQWLGARVIATVQAQKTKLCG